jgi:hypothetical protein
MFAHHYYISKAPLKGNLYGVREVKEYFKDYEVPVFFDYLEKKIFATQGHPEGFKALRKGGRPDFVTPFGKSLLKDIVKELLQ